MVRIAVAALLTFTVSVLAVGDPSGADKVGKGQRDQFITGECLTGDDCQTCCCAGLQDGAVCSAALVSTDAGKQGCGFGGFAAGGPCEAAGLTNFNNGQNGQNGQNDDNGNVQNGDNGNVQNDNGNFQNDNGNFQNDNGNFQNDNGNVQNGDNGNFQNGNDGNGHVGARGWTS